MFAHIKLAKIIYKPINEEVTFQIQEQSEVQWSPNLHLKILTLFTELTQFILTMKSALPSSAVPVTESIKKPKKQLNWLFMVKGDFFLRITISSYHEMLLIASDLMARNSNSYVGGEAILLRIIIDSSQIFTFEGIRFSKVSNDEEITEERKRTEGLVLDNNQIW